MVDIFTVFTQKRLRLIYVSLQNWRFSFQLHWPWLASLALSLFVFTTLQIELPELQRNNVVLTKQIESVRMLMNRPISPSTSSEKSSRLITALPKFSQLSNLTNDLHLIAEKNAVILSNASYKPLDEGNKLGIKKIEITIHAKGSYFGVKNTIGTLFSLHDGLTLESINLQRARSTDSVEDIELRLGFYYRSST